MPEPLVPPVEFTTTPRAPSGDPYLEDLMTKPWGSFIFLRDVTAITGLPETYVRSLVQRGEFPAPVRLDGRRQCFVLGEVMTWLAEVKRDKRARELPPDAAAAVRKGGIVRQQARKRELPTEGEQQ